MKVHFTSQRFAQRERMEPRLSFHGNTIDFATQTASKIGASVKSADFPSTTELQWYFPWSSTGVWIVRSVDQSLHRTGPTTDVPWGSSQASSQQLVLHSKS